MSATPEHRAVTRKFHESRRAMKAEATALFKAAIALANDERLTEVERERWAKRATDFVHVVDYLDQAGR